MGTRADFDNEAILHLLSLKEVFGGFAHEIAQPLNAVMIASQVLKLKAERSALPDEERAFFSKRLDLISEQVNRATKIVENLRGFGRRDPAGQTVTNLKKVFDKVYELMGQQLVARGIDLDLVTDPELPTIGAETHIAEGVVSQLLSYGRDSVETLARRHSSQGMTYVKLISARLSEMGGRSRLDLSWEGGELETQGSALNPFAYPGLEVSREVLALCGGALDATKFSVSATL